MQKLLTIGVNAYPDAPLNGCVPDSQNVEQAWRARFGLDLRVRQLLDGDATCRNIINELGDLITGARPYEDALTFHMSSHGTQVRDTDGDERTDRLDECLCSVDFSFSRPETWITDDALSALLKAVPEGVNLTLVIDACHSGSLLRAMPGQPVRLAGPDRRARVYPVRDPEVQRRLSAAAAYGIRSLVGLRPAVVQLGRSFKETRRGVLISATTAKQLAADAFIAGQAQGAHTYALLKVLRAHNWNVDYARLVATMRGWLNQAGYGGEGGQTPQLQGLRAARRLQAFVPYPRA